MAVKTPALGASKGAAGDAWVAVQVWLQEFAWLESEKARKLARRNSSLPPDQLEEIAKEPMFCVETMMIALYWSLLAYDLQEVGDPPTHDRKHAEPPE